MWNDLTMSERADVIKMAVKAGLRDMKSIRDFYDNSLKYAEGGPKATYGKPYYSYDKNMQIETDNGKPILNYSATLPEVNIIPDSKKSPADRNEAKRFREKVFSDNAEREDRDYTQRQIMRSQRDWDNSLEKKALGYAQDAMTGIGIGADIVSGYPIYSSLKGSRVLSEADSLPEYIEGGLWLAPIGGAVGKEAYSIGKNAWNTSKNALDRLRYLGAIENGSVSNNNLLNDRMLNELTFVNGKRVYKPVKTVEDVVSFTYGLPKGITPKTKLSSLTNEQMYNLALRDIQRENPGDWFIGIGNSAKNNRYIHMDANSSIIPTTEGFLPTREGFTKVSRYGTPEIWYNKDIPYYPRELSYTPRTVVTTKKALGIEDSYENVIHTPRTLKYNDILFGLEPNEFGSYNRVLYSPNKKAPLNTTIYNTSTNPDNIFNIQRKVK